MSAYLPPLAAFLTAYAVLRWLLHGLAWFALDHPNERSLHSAPVPRTGGLGIMAGVAAGWATAGGGPMWPVWASAGLLLLLSLLDDVRSLPISARLLAHVAVAAGTVSFIVPADIVVGGFLLAVLVLIWSINLYNFMDGMDGLAGGMTLFGFLTYSAVAWVYGDYEFAMTNLVVAMSACAFLLFNFHPARIFMGDSGSIPLGFLAATLGLLGWSKDLWPMWFPLWVFSPFVLDSSVTLVKRMMRGERVWQAHREHYYQRLVRMGCTHSTVAWGEYGLMVFAGITGLWALRQSDEYQGLLAVFLCGIYLVGMLVIDIYWKRFLMRQRYVETKQG